MDSGFSTRIDRESGNTVPVQQGTFGGIPMPEKLPMNTTVMQLVDSETSVQLKSKSTSQSVREESSSAESTSPKAKQVSLSWSVRVCKARDRLIETL